MVFLPVGVASQEVTSATGYDVRFGGRVQIQYETGNGDQAPSFHLRRVWATLDASAGDLVDARAQTDAQNGQALEAWMRLNLSESFRLQFGQIKRGMSGFWYVANFDLPVIERDARIPGLDECPGVGGTCTFGQYTFSLGLDSYEPGMVVSGALGEAASYRLQVSNGDGLGRSDANARKSLTGQLTLDVREGSRLTFYGSLDDKTLPDGISTSYPAVGIEWETGTWRSGPHLLVGAVRGTNWKVAEDAPFLAFQALGLWYRELERSRFAAIEPMLRISWAASEDMQADRAGGIAITPGVMLYAVGRNGIAANLDLYRPLGARRAESRGAWYHSLKVQAFARF